MKLDKLAMGFGLPILDKALKRITDEHEIGRN